MSTQFIPSRSPEKQDLHSTDFVALAPFAKSNQINANYLDDPRTPQFGTSGTEIRFSNLLGESLRVDWIPPEKLLKFVEHLHKMDCYLTEFDRNIAQDHAALFEVLGRRGIGLIVSY